MTDIFISYKREDQPKARKLAKALTESGWVTWWDPALVAGERFDDVIGEVLEQSRCTIVLWSELSVNSKYVRDEASFALERDKLVPVRLDAAELPFRFRGLHTLDFSAWDGASGHSDFQELYSDLCKKIGKPSDPLPFEDDDGGGSTDPSGWGAGKFVFPALGVVALTLGFAIWQQLSPFDRNDGEQSAETCYLKVQVDPVEPDDEVFYLERLVGGETTKLPASTMTLEPHHLDSWQLNVVWKSDGSFSATGELRGCQNYESVMTTDEMARVSFTVVD